MIIFAYPLVFLLLIVPFIYREIMPPIKGLHGDGLKVPPALLTVFKEVKHEKSFGFIKPDTRQTNRIKMGTLLCIWALLLCAAARPQIVGDPIPLRSDNREIMMVMDISTSMLERDFIIANRYTDRLTAVKKTVSEFIKKRSNDKIGIIFFATNSYLQVPMTFDKKTVEETMLQVDAGMAGNSTAIGDALGLALKTLRDEGALNKKIIILLTDGENNDGRLSMAEAVDLARRENIKIYTIGVGSKDAIVQSMLGFNIKLGGNGLDEESLKEIAQATKGTYFRAEDTAGLEKIYKTIDKLEPSKNEDVFIREVKEIYYIPLIFALVLSTCFTIWIRRVQK